MTLKGKWARESAGGSLSCATFYRNPQYRSQLFIRFKTYFGRLHVESALGPLEFHFLLHFPEEVTLSTVTRIACNTTLGERMHFSRCCQHCGCESCATNWLRGERGRSPLIWELSFALLSLSRKISTWLLYCNTVDICHSAMGFIRFEHSIR